MISSTQLSREMQKPEKRPRKFYLSQNKVTLIACLHDRNKSGFLERPAFIQPIRTIWKAF